MRLKFALASLFAIVAMPAFAHPEHGFQLPHLLHVVTEADHLAIVAGAVLLMAIVGLFVFKRSRK